MVTGVEAHTEDKMAMESHMEGSKGGYKMKEKGAKTIRRKWMSQAELDKDMAKIREELDVLTMLLGENQGQGWDLKKKQRSGLSYREGYDRDR